MRKILSVGIPSLPVYFYFDPKQNTSSVGSMISISFDTRKGLDEKRDHFMLMLWLWLCFSRAELDSTERRRINTLFGSTLAAYLNKDAGFLPQLQERSKDGFYEPFLESPPVSLFLGMRRILTQSFSASFLFRNAEIYPLLREHFQDVNPRILIVGPGFQTNYSSKEDCVLSPQIIMMSHFLPSASITVVDPNTVACTAAKTAWGGNGDYLKTTFQKVIPKLQTYLNSQEITDLFSTFFSQNQGVSFQGLPADSVFNKGFLEFFSEHPSQRFDAITCTHILKSFFVHHHGLKELSELTDVHRNENRRMLEQLMDHLNPGGLLFVDYRSIDYCFPAGASGESVNAFFSDRGFEIRTFSEKALATSTEVLVAICKMGA